MIDSFEDDDNDDEDNKLTLPIGKPLSFLGLKKKGVQNL